MMGVANKKTPADAGIFSDALKGRKGEKEMGILNLLVRVQSPEERECRRESENSGPDGRWASGHWV
jgi:hypothetical protein